MTQITVTDLNNAKLDVDTIANIANSTATSVTDRLGGTRRTLYSLAAEFPNASDNAAATAADAAATAADRVQTGLDVINAEAARDAANTIGKVFASTALGIAGTTNGESFSVLSVDLKFLTVYTNNAGVADVVTSYYTRTALDSIFDSTGYSQSGYAAAFVDSENRMAWYVDSTGAFGLPDIPDVKGEINTLKNQTDDYSSESGVAWGIYDANNRLPLSLDLDGCLRSKGINISNPEKSLACFGDSLTANGYPALLAALYNPLRTAYNGGFGGDTSSQIAFRQGGLSVLLSVGGNSIPASGSVSVTPSVSTILQTGNSKTGELAGITGTLTNTAGAYTFTRTTAGSAIAVPSALYFNPDGNGQEYKTNIFWVGQNNTLDASGSAAVLANVASMVSFLKAPTHNKRFIVMSVLGANMGVSGTTGYNNLIAHNNALRDLYPRNYIDARALMIRNYNPALPQDVIDFNNDIVPSSLRLDSVHLNPAGDAILVAEIKRILDLKGW